MKKPSKAVWAGILAAAAAGGAGLLVWASRVRRQLKKDLEEARAASKPLPTNKPDNDK